MNKRIFVFLTLTMALFVTPSWAGTCSPPVEGTSCTNTFSPGPGTTTGTYDFSATGDGILVVKFDTVLTTFTLTVTVTSFTDTIDTGETGVFPAGTVPVMYSNGHKDQYDFTGTGGGGLNGLPAKNIDYKRLITLTLSYFTSKTVHDPAFGHAPGDTTTISEDILTSYSVLPLVPDPTMSGTTPGLSSVAALDEPLASNDTFCLVSPQEGIPPFSVGQEIEVEFQLFPSGPCLNNSGTPLRDKTARLSVSTKDTSGNVIFPRLRNKEHGDKFHFDHEDGVNEFDLSTHRLLPGQYTITIFGSNFSPQSVNVTIIAGTDADDDPD